MWSMVRHVVADFPDETGVKPECEAMSWRWILPQFPTHAPPAIATLFVLILASWACLVMDSSQLSESIGGLGGI